MGNNSGHGAGQIPREICARLEAMRTAAGTTGAELRPPLLMLGTSERVGSNWLSDTLRPIAEQHNEPFRQQLAPDHGLSALNPHPGRCTAEALGTLGWHWLVTFAASKHSERRQVVKETNLFFALPTLLALFPQAPVAVLTRSPLGVASSFTRGDLFRRWAYRGRYQQMVTATRSGHQARYGMLVPDDDPPDLVALVRLQVLNTVLLATALAGRDIAVIPYETAVICPQTAVDALAAVVPDLGVQPARRALPAAGCSAVAAAEDTFVTTVPKVSQTAFLEDTGAELVRATTAAALAAARTAVPAPVVVRASAWLAGDHLYTLRPPPVPRARPARRPAIPEPVTSPGPRYLRRVGLEWRNLLVSNAEFAAFLNELADAGLANSHAGTYLLTCEMPHERGGRLHRDPATGRWHVSEGYEHHPVYWVTWIGAAAFAAWSNARLPTRAEMIEETRHQGAAAANADYQFGDVTPVTEPGRPADEIHHLVGNVQVWCCDGPSPAELHDGALAPRRSLEHPRYL